MGQCHYCARSTMTTTDTRKGRKCTLSLPKTPPAQRGLHKTDSDPALDSGHSSGDEASCSGVGGNGVGAGSAGDGTVECPGRGSHSSESSGKYSLRGSVGSLGDDRTHYIHTRIEEFPIDSPVFEEQDPLEDDDGCVFAGDSLHPLQDTLCTRKFSRGSSRGSRGSTSSERGSISSVNSVTALLKARLGRSASLSVPGPGADPEVLSTCSSIPPDPPRRHRTVSLRLPRSHCRGSSDSDTNLPTIYVDDSPGQEGPRRGRRKSSLQRALSLLSLNTLIKHEAAAVAEKKQKQKQQQQQQQQQKQVQKILRQPRRRHNTVRGLSGMAIDGVNQGPGGATGLHRCHTLYYPTNATIRHATTTARRTTSLST